MKVLHADEGAPGKQRRRWTDEEHRKLVEGLKLYGRDWKRIQAHVGTRNAAQLRSHAQKYFVKVLREGSGEYIPPPQSRRTLINPNVPLPEVVPKANGTFAAKLGSARQPPPPVATPPTEAIASAAGGATPKRPRLDELFECDPRSPTLSDKGGCVSRPRTPLGELARDEHASQSPRPSPLRPADIERAAVLAARASPLRSSPRWQVHVPTAFALENAEHLAPASAAATSTSANCYTAAVECGGGGTICGRSGRGAARSISTPLCLSYSHSGQATRVVPIASSVQTTSPLSGEAPSDFDSGAAPLPPVPQMPPCSPCTVPAASIVTKSSPTQQANSVSSGGSNLHLLSLVADTIGRCSR